MDISLKFHTDPAAQIPVSLSAINHLIDGSNDPQSFVFYLSSINALKKFQAASNPGVDDLFVEVINVTSLWAATTTKVLNDTVRTTAKNGYRYKAQAVAGAGNTGASEPAWTLTIGQTVVDGDITWINDGKLHESTEMKLALSLVGLDTAVAGASVNLGSVITGGAANNIPLYIRVDDATAIVDKFVDLGIGVLNARELAI
ncbi:MAG: hypothetical protein GQ532_14570 [Methylomarinum sp.]|nr:hypothetical protein [Methylomarinum sp.]